MDNFQKDYLKSYAQALFNKIIGGGNIDTWIEIKNDFFKSFSVVLRDTSGITSSPMFDDSCTRQKLLVIHRTEPCANASVLVNRNHINQIYAFFFRKERKQLINIVALRVTRQKQNLRLDVCFCKIIFKRSFVVSQFVRCKYFGKRAVGSLTTNQRFFQIVLSRYQIFDNSTTQIDIINKRGYCNF